MATIDPSQDYDCILTITLTDSSGTIPVRFVRGTASVLTSGNFYYRMGTSGAWSSETMANPRNITYTSSTMQIGFDWNKDGSNNYTTPQIQSTDKVKEIAISQKAVLSGAVGNYFFYQYAYGCSSLTSLDVPDTSGLTSVGNSFFSYYANGCSSLTSLDVPDTSGLTSIGNSFFYNYANGCSSLTSLEIPALDSLFFGSLPFNFMAGFAQNANKLEEVLLPDSPNIYTDFNIDWNVPSDRSCIGKTDNEPGWEPLLVSGKTLHTNKVTSLAVRTPPPPPNVFSLKLYHEGNWLSLAMPA